VALAALMGQRIRLTRQILRSVTVFGLCQNAIYLGLFFIAMQTIEAGLASIIASMMPLLVAGIQAIVFRQSLPLFGNVGLLVGFAGVCALMASRIGVGADITGVLLCCIGVCALAIATLTVKSASAGGNLLMIVGLQMLVGGLALLPFGLLTETWVVTWSPTVVIAFVYTIFVPGILATIIWFMLVNRIGPIKAATFHFLNPFFGVAIAAVLLGEQLGLVDYIGVATIMVGILAVQLARVQVRA
jgi:drug/metabolite transporter (DMT)-like permease